MAQKKPVLGRGLDALLSSARSAHSQAPIGAKEASALPCWDIPLDAIVANPLQPRQHFEPQALEELATSIRSQGVIQPIVVRSVGPHQFEIVAGERRYRAASMAGLERIPAVCAELNDEQSLLWGLLENMARSDLNPLEEARGMYRLLHDFGLTHQQTAETLGCSRSHVSNTLRLLQLHDTVKRYLQAKQLDMGHARALLALPEREQIAWADRIVQGQWSVRETEKALSDHAKKRASMSNTRTVSRAPDPNIEALQRHLSEEWGIFVDIRQRASGGGKLVIHYDDWSQMDPLLRQWLPDPLAFVE